MEKEFHFAVGKHTGVKTLSGEIITTAPDGSEKTHRKMAHAIDHCREWQPGKESGDDDFIRKTTILIEDEE